jgi:hypothetical protein
MNELIALQRYPLHRPESTQAIELVKRCAEQLESDGMFTLPGLVRPAAVDSMLTGILEKSASEAFTHDPKNRS